MGEGARVGPGGGRRTEPHRSETDAIRTVAETIRRELRSYVVHGGSAASFLPRVRRAHRHLRRHEIAKVLSVLDSLEADLRERL